MSEKEFNRKKQKLKEMEKNTISNFELLPIEDKMKLSKQLKCSLCKSDLEGSNFVYNGKLICKECSKVVREELREYIKISKEVKELERYMKRGK